MKSILWGTIWLALIKEEAETGHTAIRGNKVPRIKERSIMSNAAGDAVR